MRLPGVDTLRGIAIFYVLMNHINMRLYLAKVPYMEKVPRWIANSLVWNGQYAVQMFFAVSGYLITSTTIRRWGTVSQVNVLDFYAVRLARIGPSLLLLLVLLSGLHLAGLKDFVVSQDQGGLPGALFAALTFHVNLLEAKRGYLPPNWDILWSLSIEEIFYLFFPLICRLLGSDRNLVGLLVGLIVLGPLGRTIFSHGEEVWKEYSYLGGMDGIAIGCFTAMLLARARNIPTPMRYAIGLIGAACLIFIFNFSAQAVSLGLIRSGLDMTIVALGTCGVITVASHTGWTNGALLSPLIKLGQRSYEVYLAHMFIVLALFNLFVARGSSLRMVPLLFVSSIVLSGLLGEILARFYSEPVNRLLRQHWNDGPDRLGAAL